MTCPNCGYMMTAFDKSCPRCASYPKQAQKPVSDQTRMAQSQAGKVCPDCGRLAELERRVCENCGHQYRTSFTPQSAAAPPQAPRPQSLTAPAAHAVSQGRSKAWNAFWVIPIIAIGFWNMAHDSGSSASSGNAGLSGSSYSNAESATVNAFDLDEAYSSNLFAADKQYKGKLLMITGTIKEIGKTEDGYPYISLYGAGKDSYIRCAFDQGADDVIAKLSTGKRVQLLGWCAGKSDDIVSLGNCVVPKQSIQQFPTGPGYG